MKILIIEDEQDIVKPLKRYLEQNGFAVDYAEDGEKGLFLSNRNDYDCILLDLNLPKIDGIELAKQLRDRNNITPIIMVTARSQMYNKLEGFDSGADDYVTKPFNLEELVARIKAVIKRNSKNKNKELILLRKSYEGQGNLELNPEQNKVIDKKTKKEIELSNKETGILEYLIRNKGKTISTEELLEHVWDSEIDTFTDTVKTHIKTLRKKIDPKKKIIKTIRGKGYLIE
jgi:DNA-binding response OmpR family regulator